MKFLTGLLAGIVIGAAGAVLYSVKSGRDLRVALDEVRADFDKRDMDAIGARLEAQFTALTAQLETRIGQVRERASSTPDQVVDLAQVCRGRRLRHHRCSRRRRLVGRRRRQGRHRRGCTRGVSPARTESRH